MRLLSPAILLLIGLTFSCNKKDNLDNSDKTEAPGVKIRFQNMMHGAPITLESQVYTLEDGDSIIVERYKYYISNIKLTATDGSEYIEPESYHLINEELTESKEFTLQNLPEKEYSRISFMIGVDSIRNVSGAQAGALDPANKMFWDWKTGYIMAVLEGKTFQNNNWEFLIYHIAGFSGKNSSVRNVSLELANKITIAKNKKTVINISSEISEWFKTPNNIDLAVLPIVGMEGEDAVKIADNYADMFSIKSIEQ